MKIRLLLFFVLFLGVVSLQSQGRRHMFRKIDQIERVKPIDCLELDEEASTKFFQKRKIFVEKRRESVAKLDSLEKFIQKGITEDKSGSNEVKKAINEYLEVEKSIVIQRYEHINLVKSLLTTEQLAKYIHFDQMFKDELREVIMERRKNKEKRND